MSKKYSNLPTCLPLPLPEDELEELFQKAIDWAIMNGVSMRSKLNFSKDTVQVAPFALLPSPIPKKEFEKVVEIQTVFNELMHRVAHNRQFLTRCLKDTIQVDEFTGNLFKIYETIMDEGICQPISLGLFRADYMINNDSLKQVEINTIASSFAGIATVITEYNRYILQELGHEDKINHLPENKAISGLSEGIVEAWKLYGNKNSVILFLVENVSFNICDQRFVEFQIRKLHPNVKIIRRTLTDVGERGSLSSSKELIIDRYTVAVIYYRSGYEPPQYPSKKEWDARLLMERSLAIKCPSIQYHLAGTKKVQQALATSGALELFLSEAKKIEAIKEVFVGLYGLDFDELGNQAVQMALENPEKFVLKPQREGGGNNVYGPDVRYAMLSMKDSKERTAWILMERIRPPVLKGYIVRAGLEKLPQLMELVSEVGIFGVVMGDPQKLITNKQVGHMLRTKAATENEGGVAAGAGALDSPYLLE